MKAFAVGAGGNGIGKNSFLMVNTIDFPELLEAEQRKQSADTIFDKALPRTKRPCWSRRSRTLTQDAECPITHSHAQESTGGNRWSHFDLITLRYRDARSNDLQISCVTETTVTLRASVATFSGCSE